MHYGVYDILNQIALYEVYGGRDQFLEAPRTEVFKVKLALIGRNQAELEQQREAQEGSGGSGGGGRVVQERTTTSSYWE